MAFSEMLAEVNGLDENGFRRWLFVDGMGFRDLGQWWTRQGRRPVAHEGVDFCLYERADGGQGKLTAGALVPAAAAGEVACIHPDFLGRTLWLRHGLPDAAGNIFYTVYGHLGLDLPISVGAAVAAGEIIGSVAGLGCAGGEIAPHLHLTAAVVSASVAPSRLCWALVQDTSLVKLLDPLTL